METQKIFQGTERFDPYNVNEDFPGIREIKDAKETVNFHNKTTVRVWYNTQASDFDSHWHNAMEFIVPIENCYDVATKGKTFHLVPGDILIIPPRELHTLITPDHGARMIYLFDISPISRMVAFKKLKPALQQPFYINETDAPGIYQNLMRIRDEYFNPEEFSELTIYACLLKILAKLGEYYLSITDYFPSVGMHKQQEYIRMFGNIMDYVDAHCMEELSLEQIADMAGFSKYHFSRLFKEYTNVNFSDYVNSRRIKAAEELLEDGTLSITDVAMRSGFPSVSTFYRLFQKQNLCSPTEFRAKQSVNLF